MSALNDWVVKHRHRIRQFSYTWIGTYLIVLLVRTIADFLVHGFTNFERLMNFVLATSPVHIVVLIFWYLAYAAEKRIEDGRKNRKRKAA